MPSRRFMSSRAARLLLCALCVAPGISAAADAPAPDECPTALFGPIPPKRPPRVPAPATPGPTLMRGDNVRSLDSNVIELNGSAQATRDGERIDADYLRYDREPAHADARGDVRISERDGTRFTTGEAHLDLDTRIGNATAGTYRLPGLMGRGDMAHVDFLDQDHTRLFDVRYTTCPQNREDWFLRARQIDLDTAEDVGVARDMTLRLFGLPVLYLPYFSFPISDQRKSGFLVPQIGYGSDLGTIVATPYYWNIAPNYDATITPRIMTQRGVQLQSEFRYLGRGYNGQLEFEYLPDDKVTGDSRAAGTFLHNQTFNPYWSAHVDVRGVSDKDYLSDFGDRLSVTSETNLPQLAEVDYRGSIWTFTARAADYQTVDRTVAPTDRPYARLPQLLLSANSGGGSGLQYQFDGELVNFDRDVGVIGQRANLSPSVRFTQTRAYGFVTPEVGARYIAYSLDQTSATDTRPSVAAPFASLDTGLYFDRDVAFGGAKLDQTLEPRLYYLYVPRRAQDNLPNFDTTVPDFSFASLFRNNRFVGGDRIGDANQLTVALTTRFLDQESGAERLRASIGRIHYFQDREVNLPPGIVGDASSDVAAEAAAWLSGNWHARATVQYAPELDQAVRSSFYLQHQPAADRIFDIGFRSSRTEQLRQIDVSAEWPLTPRWIFRGRSLYSIRDRENVDSFLGVEYRSCCWAIRLYGARQLVQTPTGSTTLTEQRGRILFEFQLAGLSGTGSKFESPLNQGLFSFPETAPTRSAY